MKGNDNGCKTTNQERGSKMRTKPTQLHIIVKEYYDKLEKV